MTPKLRYTAHQAFADGGYFVDIRHENGFHDWLKVGDVPKPVRKLLQRGRLYLESAECRTMKDARTLAAWMNRFSEE